MQFNKFISWQFWWRRQSSKPTTAYIHLTRQDSRIKETNSASLCCGIFYGSMFSRLCYELYFWSNHKWKHCSAMVWKCTIFLGKIFTFDDPSLFYIFRNHNLLWSGIVVKRPQKVLYQWCEKQIIFSHYGVLAVHIWRECL